MRVLSTVQLGDSPGHDFHGNQWTAGGGVEVGRWSGGTIRDRQGGNNVGGTRTVSAHDSAGKQIGYITYSPVVDEHGDVDMTGLFDMNVDPEHQRQGAATAMLDYIASQNKYGRGGVEIRTSTTVEGDKTYTKWRLGGKATALSVVSPLEFGDVAGHDFHGNQWTGGTGSADAIIERNPRLPGEDSFAWQSRIIKGLPENQQSAILFKVRETYPAVPFVAQGIQTWCAEHGLPVPPSDCNQIPVNQKEADAVAAYFEKTPDQSGDPRVQAAYADFRAQSAEMYAFLTKPESEGGLGVKVDFTNKVNPYPDAAAQAADLRDNHHFYIESGLGGAHEATMTQRQYDEFRAVHDVFGHAGIGGGFDRHGEYQAWLVHASMYVGAGRDAMSTEYHGVNSAAWTGAPGTPGTGKSLLLPEKWSNPPWDREGLTASAGLDLDELIDKLGLDAKFAREYDKLPWHPLAKPPIVSAAFMLELGDTPGHDFHGNQWAKVSDSTEKGPFGHRQVEAKIDGKVVGSLEYTKSKDRLGIWHIHVDPSVRRQGLASHMLDTLVKLHGAKVVEPMTTRSDAGNKWWGGWTDKHSVTPITDPYWARTKAVVASTISLELGDVAGHDFHGNQWTGGVLSAEERSAKYGSTPAEVRRAFKAIYPNAKIGQIRSWAKNEKPGTTFDKSYAHGFITALAQSHDELAKKFPEVAANVRSVSFTTVGGFSAQTSWGSNGGYGLKVNSSSIPGLDISDNPSKSVGGHELGKDQMSMEATERYGYATGVHEFGHLLDYSATRMAMGVSRSWENATNTFNSLDRIPGGVPLGKFDDVSPYAGRNSHEGVAEAFTAVQLKTTTSGNPPSAEVRNFVGRLIASAKNFSRSDATAMLASALEEDEELIEISDDFGPDSIVWKYAGLPAPTVAAGFTLEFEFNPDQARNEKGEWTSVGGEPLLAPIEGSRGNPLPYEMATMSVLPKDIQAKVMQTVRDRVASPQKINSSFDHYMAVAWKDPAVKEAGMNWYQQQHDVAVEIAKGAGLETQNVAAAMAAMSPGTQWNIEEPIIRTMAELDKQKVDLSPERAARLNAALDGYNAGMRWESMKWDAKELNKQFDKEAEGKSYTPRPFREWEPVTNVSNGDKFSELNPRTAVMTMQAQAMEKDILPLGWGVGYGYGGFAKGLDLMRGANVDDTLPGVKVRSFTNNIMDPSDNRDVTIDIHMVQGSARDPKVVNDSGVMSAPAYKTASIGAYPYIADVVRRVASDYGVRPNQAQALIWLGYKAEFGNAAPGKSKKK